MPLLNRKAFSPTKLPPDLKPDEEVFVCRHTNEVFRDYRSFFERTILCSSMLWSCKYTGKSGLTYQEALESERSIKKQGRSLPEPIQRAALTLVHHTQRGRLANLCDEVFSYLKDRYQEGEEVEVNHLSNKKRGIITQVIPPPEGSLNKTAKVGKLLSPKSRKHSQSGDKLQSPTSQNRKSSSDGTPIKERTNSSSSSDSQPLSAKKYCSDNVFAKSPTGKSPRKSLDEESHSKSKSRKHSVESSSEKTPSKSRKHSSDGKSTPSKPNSDNTPKKPSTPSSRKASDNKLVSPKSKSSSDGTESSKTNKSPSTSKTKNFEGEIVIIDDNDDVVDGDKGEKSPQRPSPKLSSPKEKPVYNWPSASLYQYEIRIYSDRKDKGSKKKEKKHEIVIVQASLVSRKKGVFTRDKVKMFLKVSCDRSTPHSEDGIYIVQRVYRQKFDLGEPDIPLKLASPKDKKRKKRSLAHGDEQGENGPAKKKRKKKKEDESKNEDVKKKKEKKEKDGKSKDNKKMKLPPGEWRKIMEEEKEKRKKQQEEERERKKQEREREKAENKAKREEERAVKKIERDKERERQREEKRLEAIRLKEWNKPREDLELDDLKDLPKTTPVTTKLPSELFGDMMMVLEFLNVFGNLFDMKDEFPSGLTFAMLEEALTEHDAEGVYYDLLLFLLGAILRTHLEEEEEEGLDGSHDHEPLMDVDDEGDEKSQSTVSASATMAAAWPMQYQGKPLHELIMDPFTSSELLRLHLLSSGARIGCGEPSYRWQRRGGFTYSDDAGVEFRHAQPQLLKALVTGNIYDMGAQDKLKVLVALCTQLITYATARDYVEEGFDHCRKVRREWQEDQWADQRKEKEEAAARYRRKQEERQRQKEELVKRKKEKDQEKMDGAKGESSRKAEDATKNGSEQNEGDQVKKSGKKTGKKKDENESSQASEAKESTVNTDSKVNGNKPAEDKDDEPNPVPVLTKEEEEELALQRKEDRKRKDQEFLNQLAKAVARSAIQPLGRDRVFRRYWAFRSLRGLFVEDDDPDQHLLLEPESDAASEDNEEGSDDEEKEDAKENENSTLDQSNSDSVKKEEKRLVNGHTKSKDTAKTENFERKVLNMFKAYQLTKEACADEDWCESYKKRHVVKWSYFTSKEDVDQLLDALNPRGFREKPLKDAIQQEYKQLSIAVEKCPLKAEIQAQKKDSKPKGKRRNQPTVDKSRYKTMEEFLEANLRDQILDLEDRIWQGGLGSVRNVNREEWRAKVENGIYSVFSKPPASEECSANGVNEVKENGDPEQMEIETSVGDEKTPSMDNSDAEVVVKEEELMDCHDHQQPVVNGVKDDIKQECHTDSEEVAKVEDKPDEVPFTAVPSDLLLDSHPSSPADGTRCSTPTFSLVGRPVAMNPALKELTLELLKVEQGIEKKYLNPPLGEDEETKRQKQKEAAAAAVSEFNEMMKAAEVKEKQKKDRRKKETDEADPKENGEKNSEAQEEEGQKDDSSSTSSSTDEPVKQKTCLERWEESLLVCTNLSQVFVHLNTLDQSIAWSKSVLNARCRLCKRKGDAEHMLLCDACDRGHHMYCLKPPIKEVPEGQWFCADCRPKETRRSERRKKPAAREELEEESEEESEEKEEESEEEDSDADDHETESKSNSEEDDSEQTDASVSSEHGDQCALCTEGGELLCCDTCPLAYHLACAYPPLRRIPRGNWACQVCTGADDERPRNSRVKKATIEAAQKSLHRSIKVVKKKTTRSTSRPTKKDPSRSRKRQISSSPSPPPRTRKTGSKTNKKTTKRRRVSSSSRSPSSRSSSPAQRTSRSSIKIAARGDRGRSSIDSSRSSSPVLRSDSGKNSAGRKNPKLTARLVLCQNLLNEMMKHEDAWPFLEAVDVNENPDYLEYVQRPVDLGTIKKNLTAKAYDSVEDFAADVRQVFINCSEYCRPRGKEARAGVRLSAFFETQYSDMGLDASETRTTRSRRI